MTKPDLEAIDRAMARDDGGPAFPAIWSHGFTEAAYPAGMSLRDYFAGQALTAILTHSKIEPSSASGVIAEYAYRYADAMLEARK